MAEGQQSSHSLQEASDNGKDSVVSLDTLEHLRADLISKNKQGLTVPTGQLKTMYNNTRLKSLDDSIQSINEHDLYKYNESLQNINAEEEEEVKKPKDISTKRLWNFMKKHATITDLIQKAKDDDTLEKRIEI